MTKASLHRLAELAGIQLRYTDVFGVVHEVPEKTLDLLLQALGFPTAEIQDRAVSLERLMARQQRALPPVKILPQDRALRIGLVRLTAWRLQGEDGTEIASEENALEEIALPALPMGYYDLHVTLRDGETCHSRLIVTPPRCWLPPEIESGKRVWGLATQLYGLRSAGNFGMGDFSDLAELGTAAGTAGADLIGINPIHAMFPNNEFHFSPYSPSSRLYLNALYIDPQAVDGFDSCEEAQKIWSDADFQTRLNAARAAELVDYPEVMRLKTPLFEALYQHFKQHGNRAKYENFVQEQGELLKDQALFDALNEHFSKERGHFVCWWEWPEDYRSARGEAAQHFAQKNAERMEYFRWLQWVADGQLARAQRLSRDAGMLLGLYRDLAVGSDQAGAEVWLEPDRFIRGVAVGAPPDRRNPRGQNWGLPPLNPVTLQEHGYNPFIQLVRANMRHARALRIDHAFGLARLFLIPQGESPRHGAYLTFHFEEMLAVLRLESHRNKCVVIGEDLGTFPPNYKDGAAESGLLSYRLLYFARDEDGSFLAPGRYPAQALATLTTHDLPTLRGWIEGADIEERTALDLYPTEDGPAKDRDERERAKPFLSQALAKENLPSDPLTLESAQRFLARSPAHIIMMQVEDLLDVRQQANIPATTTQRPNWRMKLPVPLETFLKDGPLEAMASALKEERERPFECRPRATYRIQFHKDFTFEDAARIVPYLAKLGISHVYASPYLAARPGSMHGYDIVDHNRLNPELGGEEGFAKLVEALDAHGMSQILDFVPNHMGIGEDNAWWMRVLEWGSFAPESNYFDIDWSPRYEGGPSKLLLPALGNHYGEVLAAGELKVEFDAAEGGFFVRYFEHRYPLCPTSYPDIWPDAEAATTPEQGDRIKAGMPKHQAQLDAIQAAIEAFNGDPEKMHVLLEKQHYRLAFWRVASSEINYRRFFDVNELAGLRMEDPRLFTIAHKLVLSLIHQGKIQGLRIDHIDGLADPAAYCRRLKSAAGEGLYLTVEKILSFHERLPAEWAVEGTSGYDALVQINSLFVDAISEKYFDRIYRRFTGDSASFAETMLEGKYLILETIMASELNLLVLALRRIADKSPFSRDFTMDGLKEALKDIIACYPVYRAYANQQNVSQADRQGLDWAVNRAKKRSALPDRSVYDFIRRTLALQLDAPDLDTVDFVRRFQQLSGPVMAKGLEDTSFYRYLRLISLNEVGGDPGKFGLSAENFHQIQIQRQAQWPHSMIATATHDTKRGEDARARLNALSEIPRDWLRMLTRWTRMNASRRTENDDGTPIPSGREEYFIYQTLLGSWPVEMLEGTTEQGMQDYLARLEAYFTKALREAKLNTKWTNPDEAYETHIYNFLRGILDVSAPNPFLQDFLPFAAQLAERGMRHSLVQTAIKLTIPGVPDVYQGTERWDLSLVDPDNRRPVDYETRMHAADSTDTLPDLLPHWKNGEIKQRLIALLLQDRAQHPQLYASGTYEPLRCTGNNASALLGYQRSEGKDSRILLALLRDKAQANECSVTLPPGQWENICDGNLYAGGEALPVLDMLQTLPLTYLRRRSG